MPYKSAAQRAYLHIHEPELAAEWDAKYGGKVVPGAGSTETVNQAHHRRPLGKSKRRRPRG